MIKTIFDKLDINDKLFKKIKIKKFDSVKNNIPLIEDYNFMADLLILPKTKDGYSGLFTMVDLATNECDFEPYKTKEPKEILECMENIFKRKHLKKPYASIKTDNGTEFKGIFHKYLYDNSILHKYCMPDRHRQMGSIENLNKQIGKIIQSYLSFLDLKNKNRNTEWIKIIPIIREQLNKFKKINIKDNPYTHIYKPININTEPKFKIGDLVYYPLETPYDTITGKIKGEKSNSFRSGDLRYNQIPKKIQQIFMYENGYRYMLKDLKNVSYMEIELLKYDKPIEEIQGEIKKIINKKNVKNRIQYLIWWKGEIKPQINDESKWIPKTQLINDGQQYHIDKYENHLKKKKKN